MTDSTSTLLGGFMRRHRRSAKHGRAVLWHNALLRDVQTRGISEKGAQPSDVTPVPMCTRDEVLIQCTDRRTRALEYLRGGIRTVQRENTW